MEGLSEEAGHPENPTLTAAKARQYGKALRCAAASSHPLGIKLLTVLLRYQERLSIDVNAQSAEGKPTPLDHANRVGNQAAINLLTDRGAKIAAELVDDRVSTSSTGQGLGSS